MAIAGKEVGRLALSDDDEALTFGEAIIRDLQGGHAMPYAGWTMYITESAPHWKAIFPR
jgi:hypothetical protein